MKILIVDDSKMNLELARDTLLEYKICKSTDVILAHSGVEAVEILDSKPIDIVILDIVMPGITGIRVLQYIKSKEKLKDLQVLMFTTLEKKMILKVCFDNGAKDFINKPIEPIEFISRVKSAIKERKYQLYLHENINTIKKQNKQLKEITKELKETQYYLVQKEKLVAIGQLAAGVAHEINNPLSYVSSNTETLKKYISKITDVFMKYKGLINLFEDSKEFTEKEMAMIREVKRNEKELNINFIMEDLEILLSDSFDGIDRVKKIVNSLRNFARQGVKDEYSYYDLNDIIEETLLLAKNEIKYTIDIEKDFNDLPDILCNRMQIGQVMLNIVMNAAQAINKQERNTRGKIIIKTQFIQENVVCQITDDGPGIGKENLDKIFNPFFTTKELGKGTGLGLSISYDIIVNKHAGELLVASERDKGATFIIKLPQNVIQYPSTESGGI